MKTITKSEKVIIFDWGGIVESHRINEYNVDCAIIHLFKRLNKQLEEKQIMQIYNDGYKNDENLYISELSKIDEVKKWFEKLKREAEFQCSFEEFCKIYEEEFSKIYYYKDVVSFAHSLKPYCKIAILSNLNYLDKKRIDMQFNLDKFDYIFLSFELKCKKPDPQIYKIVEERLNVKSQNILFIDDSKENILVAQKRGWNTCHAFGYELDKIKKVVEKFLND